VQKVVHHRYTTCFAPHNVNCFGLSDLSPHTIVTVIPTIATVTSIISLLFGFGFGFDTASSR
jgi:hypothetical protein